MLPEATQAAPKFQGNITFDPSTQLEKKLDFQQGGTCIHIVSKFHEHPTKHDFIKKPSPDFLCT